MHDGNKRCKGKKYIMAWSRSKHAYCTIKIYCSVLYTMYIGKSQVNLHVACQHGEKHISQWGNMILSTFSAKSVFMQKKICLT